jgi:hypothetical protein
MRHHWRGEGFQLDAACPSYPIRSGATPMTSAAASNNRPAEEESGLRFLDAAIGRSAATGRAASRRIASRLAQRPC